MAMPDEQRDTATGAAWLSVAVASQIAGISKRAMQKRATLGQIGARKVGDGAAARWEIDGRELTANSGANCEPIGREPRTDERPKFAPNDAIKREIGRELRTGNRELSANSTANRELIERELWREREAELKSEITFLRGVVESDRRDMAEVRAALREALKLAPKQLTAAPSGATSAPEVETAKDNASGSQRPTVARQSGEIDYGSICDLIEKGLNEH